MKRCHRLWRRLSVFVHPDRSTGEEMPECLQVTTLNEHKQDELYLEGMEGAVDPFFRVRRGDALEEETGRWFDRLFELRDLQEELWREAEKARGEAESYGTEWKEHLDKRFAEADEALRVLEAKIDAYWWDLKRHLGREPIAEGKDE